MVKYKRDPLRERSEEDKLLEMIDDVLPELVRTRNRLNSVIMEMDYYKSIRKENTYTSIAKIIMKACCNHFNVYKSDIEGLSRDTDVRMARQIFMVLTKESTKLSFAKVAAIIGKDHSTAMHAKKVVHNSTDPINEHYLIIKKQVNQAVINAVTQNKVQGLD